MVAANTCDQNQNTSFHDSSQSWEVQMPSQPDSTFNQAGYSDADLSSFLSRPVNIFTTTWTVGGSLSSAINPWSAYFNHATVKKKLDNFHLLRCKLHVKVIINGSPFHYGRAIMSYHPWHLEDETLAPTLNTELLIQRSQRPKVFIDPTESMGGCLCLPFLHYDNWLNVNDSISFIEMGQIDIDSINILQHANDALEPVTLKVYVWASDVKLCVPTLDLSLQSGSDEYGQGVVSAPASALANVASKLESVPVIGPYATATRMAARGVAAVARLFGFSRPAIVSQIAIMKRTTFGSMSNTNTDEAVQKLSLDVKQEVTLDSRVVGLDGSDELTISSINQRESYLTTFNWNSATTADTLLYNITVNPMKGLRVLTANTLTPVAYATLPFRYWSGTLIFRFQIVASKYHRGRLRFAFDPANDAIATDSDTFNVAYNRVVDIAQEKDFEMAVSWAAFEAYKAVPILSTLSVGSTVPLSIQDTDNGLLTVWSLTALGSSTDTSNIGINVYIRAGDDFESIVPEGEVLDNLAFFVAQSGVVGTDELANFENCPEGSNELESIGHEFTDVEKKALVFTGERMVSFRNLMRRYSYYNSYSGITGPGVNDVAALKVTIPYYPLHRGFDPQGVHVTTGGPDPYNYVHMSLLSYLTPAFIVRRGSYRHKFRAIGGHRGSLSITRMNDFAGYSITQTIVANAATTDSAIARKMAAAIPNMFSGAAVTATEAAPVLETEWPYYNKARFTFAQSLSSNALPSKDGSSNMGGELTYVYHNDLGQETSHIITHYVSTGEDFNLSFFLNVPRFLEIGDPL